MAVLEKRFTKRWLIDLSDKPPSVRTEYKDSENRFLRARVTPKGKVTLSVYKCPRGAKAAVRVSLGVTVNSVMPDASELRRMANTIISSLDKGVNPNESRKSGGLSLEAALNSYLENAQIRPSTAAGYRQRIEGHFENWLGKPIASLINAKQLLVEHRRIASYAPIAANNALQALRRVVNYSAAIHKDLPDWPTDDLSRLDIWSEQQPRNRKVHPSEFPDFWQALMSLKSEEQRDYFLFLLLTGCRRREALALRVSDIDLRRRDLTFRATKNGSDHVIPLTPTIESLIDRRLRSAASRSDSKLFSLHEPKSITRKIQKETGLQISPHDLRRTFAALGNTVISTAILKALLNHKGGKDVTDDYIGEIDSETLREALESIEKKIGMLAGVSSLNAESKE